MALKDRLDQSEDVQTLLSTLDAFTDTPSESVDLNKTAGDARAALVNFIQQGKAGELVKFIKLSSSLSYLLNANNQVDSTGTLDAVRRQLADFGFPYVGGYKPEEQMDTLVGETDQLRSVIELQQQMGKEAMRSTRGFSLFSAPSVDNDKALQNMEVLESIKQDPMNAQAVVQAASGVDARVEELAEQMQSTVRPSSP